MREQVGPTTHPKTLGLLRSFLDCLTVHLILRPMLPEDKGRCSISISLFGRLDLSVATQGITADIAQIDENQNVFRSVKS